MTKIIGIDLAGVPRKDTGFAIVNGSSAKTKVLKTDEEIIKAVKEVESNSKKKTLVTIDSPLGYPKGRCCLDYNCDCRKHGCMRVGERQLVKIGVRVFPCGFGGMRKLTNRGIKLKNIFEDKGYKVIETYPGSAQDLLGMPRKGKNNETKEELRKALIKYGFKGDIEDKGISDHELDAITSGLVGQLYRKGEYIALGIEEEAKIITAKPSEEEKLDKLKELGVIG